jgi:hypothetical protein
MQISCYAAISLKTGYLKSGIPKNYSITGWLIFWETEINSNIAGIVLPLNTFLLITLIITGIY